MNIDDLTYGELKRIAEMFNSSNMTITNPMVGKYCIARCKSSVHAGTVVSIDGENVVLEYSTRLWPLKDKDGVALSGVANHGIIAKEPKLDLIHSIIYLTCVYELIPCSKAAMDSILDENINNYSSGSGSGSGGNTY